MTGVWLPRERPVQRHLDAAESVERIKPPEHPRPRYEVHGGQRYRAYSAEAVIDSLADFDSERPDWYRPGDSNILPGLRRHGSKGALSD